MRHIGLLLIVGVFFLCHGAVPAQEKKIELTTVKYDGLKQEILKHRGKVVIVDFWATYCIPCIKAFPHYVELQKQYADKGLVVITVSIDPADKTESARKTLNRYDVALRNLIIDESPEFVTKKFDLKGVPFCYIFDRQGKWVRIREVDTPNYDQTVEKTLLQLLSEK